MRAYRPSRMGEPDCEEQTELDRQWKLAVYAERARVGLPLFEPAVVPMHVPVGEYFARPPARRQGGAA